MKYTAYFISLILLIISCSDNPPLELSPYSVNLEEDEIGKHSISKTNATKRVLTPNNFKFAVMAGTKDNYDVLKATIDTINENPNIMFVIHLGNLVESGIKQQYRTNLRLLSTLRRPYFVVMGIGEYGNNGQAIYQQMFGSENDFMAYGNTKIIFFDSLFDTTETHNMNGEEDLIWLEGELAASVSYNNIFVFSNLSPLKMEGDTLKDNFLASLEKYDVKGTFHGNSQYLEETTKKKTRFFHLGFDGAEPYYLLITVNGAEFEVSQKLVK